jgi:signal transduction histidine kinase
VTGHDILVGDGAPIAHADTTIRRRAKPLDETRFFTGLIEGMRCGMLAVDTRGRLVLINEPGRQILGLSCDPRPGAPFEDVLEEHPRLVQMVRQSFDMANLPNRAEIELGRGGRAGSHGKSIGFTVSLVRDDEGAMAGVALFFKDLTQIEHKAEQERLRDRLATLGQMAASLAHEMRNPLAGIEVSCQLLKRRLPEPNGGKDLLDKITAEVLRLNSTLTQTLEFVRPIAASFAECELVPVLEEAIATASGRVQRESVVVRRRFAGSLPRFLMDPTLLRQVFVNLILNAIEAMDGKGTVTVSVEMMGAPSGSTPYRPEGTPPGDLWQEAEHFAVVRVADTGPGIREQDRERIFYPFFTTKSKGSGVGLAIAKKIVGSHHGLIEVESTPGEGAVFTVRLPMVVRNAEDRGR